MLPLRWQRANCISRLGRSVRWSCCTRLHSMCTQLQFLTERFRPGFVPCSLRKLYPCPISEQRGAGRRKRCGRGLCLCLALFGEPCKNPGNALAKKGFLHGKQVMIANGMPTTNAGVARHVLPAWPACDPTPRAHAHPSPDQRAVLVRVPLDPLNSHARPPNFCRTGSRPSTQRSRGGDR
jgi:hypothetical protein